jgi:hypothetical protein
MQTDRQAFRTNENTPEKREEKILIKKFVDFSALKLVLFNHQE